MNKLGVHFAFWERNIGVIDADKCINSMKKAAGIGFDIVELSAGPFYDMGRADMDRLKNAAKEYGIEPVYSYCFSADNDISAKDEATRRRGIDFMKQVLKNIGYVSGSTAICGITNSSWHGVIEDSKQAHWERAVESVKEIIKETEEFGITYLLETVNRFETYMLNTHQESLRFARDVGHPNIKVHLDTFHMNIEEDDMEAAIINAGDMPDVFFMYGTSNALPFIKAGALEPILPHFEASGAVDKMTPDLIRAFSFPDGNIYALHIGTDFNFFLAFLQNKDMFAEYGIETPVTWDEFKAALVTLKSKGVIPLLVNGKDGFALIDLYEMMVYAEDPQAIEKLLQTKTIGPDDPVFLNAANRLKELADMDVFQKGFLNDDYSTCIDYFSSESAGMMLCETWALTILDQPGHPAELFVDLVPMPSAKEGLDLSSVYITHGDPGQGHAISATSKYKDEAAKLTK